VISVDIFNICDYDLTIRFAYDYGGSVATGDEGTVAEQQQRALVYISLGWLSAFFFRNNLSRRRKAVWWSRVIRNVNKCVGFPLGAAGSRLTRRCGEREKEMRPRKAPDDLVVSIRLSTFCLHVHPFVSENILMSYTGLLEGSL
jgi:hypothetical protein